MKKKPKFMGYRLLGNRITSSRQARQMLGRLAGLRSARKQRAKGWPNLRRATAMRRLRCRFRRCAAEAGLSAADFLAAWRAVMLMGPERALGLDMTGWMKRREFEPSRPPQPADWRQLLWARASERLRNEAEIIRHDARIVMQQPDAAIAPLGLRGMSLRQARRRGLVPATTRFSG